MTNAINRFAGALRAAAAALVLVAAVAVAPAFAASEYQGVWKVTDTAGAPFEITLSADGAAKATRGEGMTGTWREDGGAAVITWNTGWTTKIWKEGGSYKKAAFAKGKPIDGAPTNSTGAEKVK